MEDQDIQKYISQTMKGSEFCELFPNLSKKLIKLTNKVECHNGLQFKTGYNEDFLDFKPWGECHSGGIYITDKDNMLQWIGYGEKDMKYCRKVTLYADSKIYIEPNNKMKVNKMELGERVKIKDLMYLKAIEIKKIIEVVEKEPEIIRNLLYLGMKVPESVQLAAVQKKGSVIKYLTEYNDHLEYVIVSSVDKESGENLCYFVKRGRYECRKEKNQMKEEEKEKDPMGRIVDCAASEKVQLAAVKGNGLAIEYLVNRQKHESYEVRLEAVKQNGMALHYIIEPHRGITVLDTPKEIIMTAINQNPESIYYLAKAGLSISEEAKLAAVKQDGELIRHLIKGGVSKEVQLEAIKQRAYSVVHLLREEYDISEELQLAIVEKDYLCIFEVLHRSENNNNKNYITEKVWLEIIKKRPDIIEYMAKKGYPLSKKIQLAAVKQDGLLIGTIMKYDKNITEEVKQEAMKQNGSAIKYLIGKGEISEEVKLEAVKQNGSAIKYLIGKGEISEEVKLEAVKQNGHSIVLLYLRGIEVREEVKLAAVKQDFMAIHYILSEKGEASEEVKKAALEKSGLDNYFNVLNILDQNSEKFRIIIQTAITDLRFVEIFG